MRKHRDWCAENDVAHAWEGQDNVCISPEFENENGTWVEVRVCENCGKKQTRPIIHNTVTNWEDVP